MGFDCVTVKKVSEKDKAMFPKMSGDKGYFRYSSGVSTVVNMMGADLGSAEPRLRGDEDPTKHKGMPLGQCMAFNDGFQVTPKECLMIADAISSSNEKLRAAVKISVYRDYLAFYPCGTEHPDDWDAAKWNAEVEFFEDYAKFCRAASEYGGFFIW